VFRKTIALAIAAAAVAVGATQTGTAASLNRAGAATIQYAGGGDATPIRSGLLHEQTEHSLGVPLPQASRRGPSVGQAHERIERMLGVPAPSVGVAVASAPPSTSSPTGFSWVDALIGAATAAGIFLLGGAGALSILRRQNLARR
jgi:hypothetical protein